MYLFAIRPRTYRAVGRLFLKRHVRIKPIFSVRSSLLKFLCKWAFDTVVVLFFHFGLLIFCGIGFWIRRAVFFFFIHSSIENQDPVVNSLILIKRKGGRYFEPDGCIFCREKFPGFFFNVLNLQTIILAQCRHI